MFQAYAKNIRHYQLPTVTRVIRCLSRDVRSTKAPSQAEIIIAGGGVIGSSVAYHLSELGWKDILILEQGSIGGGTTWHSAAMCGSVRFTQEETLNSLYGLELYEKFEKEYGIGFKKCGSLGIAKTSDRSLYLHRTGVKTRQFGADCEVINTKEAKEMHPFLKLDDIQLCLYSPNDGVVNPTDLVQAYLRGAKKHGGTKVLEGVEVLRVENDKHRVTSVDTSLGKINCDVFINCAGMWARQLGQKSIPPVEIPLHASEHFYIVSKPIENVNSMLPVLRDYDARIYAREWSGGLMCGGFEPNGKPCFYDGVPEKFEFQLLQEDWKQFEYLLNGILHRLPCMERAEIRQFVNGPESFTPDITPFACKSIELDNYYIAAGMSSKGVVSSAGVGKTISELVTHVETAYKQQAYDVRRLSKDANNLFYLRDTTVWSLQSFYEMIYPVMSIDNCRNFLNSPLHGLLFEHNAVWMQDSNWEIPAYFMETEGDDMIPTFGRPNWLKIVQSEIKYCTENIGVVDYSSKSKFVISCADEEILTSFLNSTCINNVSEMASNDFMVTAVLNNKKECQSIVSLIKENPNKYTIITSPDQHTRLLSSLTESIRKNDLTGITVEDISGKYACLALLGPHVEELLNELLAPPYNTDQIPNNSCKRVDIGYASNVKLAHHFMGEENGWQLLIPTEFSQGLYQHLMSYGKKYNIQNVGHFALNSIKTRNRIPAYNFEIDTKTSYETIQKLFGCKQPNDEFPLQLLEISVPCPENWPWGGEPVLHKQELIGELSSVGYTQENDKVLGLVVSNKQVEEGEELIVQCGLDMYNAKVVSN